MAEKRQKSDNQSESKRVKLSDSGPVSKVKATARRKEEAELGIIESVSLKNFMCHSHLDFKFGPHVNFIIGRNGSGKSAILTSIVVGLGGKAVVTGRGPNFKGFIKNGKQVAETAVRIRNSGADSYKPDEYGSVITIERRITADGSSSYKLKSEAGTVISTKREELIHIMDQLNIQIDNPVSVLNQETSRSFLNFKSPKDKYLFFLKATQLEQMKQDYTRTDEQEKIIIDILEKKKKTLPELEKEVNEWQRKWEFYHSLEKQRKKLDRLRDEFAWAYVVEKEKILEEKFEKVEEQKKCTPKFLIRVHESQKKLEKTIEKKQEIQIKLQQINAEIHIIQPQHIEAKCEMGSKKKLLRNRELELRKAVNEISLLKKEIEDLKKGIKELKMGGQQDNASEKQKRLENIQILEQRKTDLIAEQTSVEFNLKKVESSHNKTNEDMYSYRQEDRNIRQQLESLQQAVSNLEKSKTNRLRRFGHYMPELLNQIARASRQKKFTKEPRGPIGTCIKLRDAKWALAIETCLKSLVFAFCCDNHQDERVLQQLMKSVIGEGRKPSIIVSKFRDEMYDVSRFSVKSSDYKSVLEMLDINDPVIANCLIDQRNVESVLLIEENREAREIMIDAVPHNCREAFTLVGDQIYPSPNFRYYSNTKKGADILQGSVEDKIREKKEDIQVLENRQQGIQGKIGEITQILQKYKTECSKTMTQIGKIRQSIGHLNVEITALKNIEDPEPVDVTILEEELEAKFSQLRNTEQIENNWKEECENAKMEVCEAEKEYHDKDETLKSLFSSSEPLKENLGSYDSEIDQLKLHKSHYDKKLKEHEKKVGELEKEYQATKAEVEAVIVKANKISPRVNTRRTPANIESEINYIEKQLKHEEEKHGSREEVTNKYHDTRKKYEQIKADVRVIENFTTNLSTMIIERKVAYDKFRKQLCLRVKNLFASALILRGYSGKLEFDHIKGTLELKVQPNSNVKELTEDMKALSGGERSFTTVCLILALWDAIESPFRILDEFDVFMDMVNRRISMDMILDTAIQKTKHQFIFLSPLDMTNFRHTPMIQICRMPDPDRNQTATTSQEEEDSV